MEKNSWLSRCRKYLVAAATWFVVLANNFAGGPDWLYPWAAAVGACLVYYVPNAPVYKDPRKVSR